MKLLILACALALTPLFGPRQDAVVQAVTQHVTAIRGSLQQSQQRLLAYEWIETTTVRLKGEQKAQHQERCYHGADGVLQKVPVGAESAPEHPRGLRGRIAEHKTEELTDEMKAVVALLHRYAPPDPERLEAARAAARVALQPLEPGKRLRVIFIDYLQAGDWLCADLDLEHDRPTALQVSTWFQRPDRPVSLDARFGALDDGTVFVQQITLRDDAEQLEVTVEHSGYRPLQGLPGGT